MMIMCGTGYMLTGYKKEAGHFSVKAVTYGGARWLDFRGLWDTGYEKKGGLILSGCRNKDGVVYFIL